MTSEIVVLGAGVTGLAAGQACDGQVVEALDQPGGICCSYYMRPGEQRRLACLPQDQEAYRFDIGGGHWIFGGDAAVMQRLGMLAPLRSYARVSSVYLPDRDLFVPYPLQNHLAALGQDIATQALAEMATAPRGTPHTLADWLRQSFGSTLTELFFGPFHELYTAGLWTRIAPQDAFKSPVDLGLAIAGAFSGTPPVGYNASYVYPENGLDALASRMAASCRVSYGRRVAHIDWRHKRVDYEDGSGQSYETLIATLPLNRLLALCELEVATPPDPYTSVLVLNIGAVRGPCCPADHWLYIPVSRTGFHRVGFYSNVDRAFLPASARVQADRAALYVERAYPGSAQPDADQVQAYSRAAVAELQSWGFIGEPEVVDATWIDVAYTWSWPGSRWRRRALAALEERSIFPVGRYGRWTFQGVADSVRDGLLVGSALR